MTANRQQFKVMECLAYPNQNYRCLQWLGCQVTKSLLILQKEIVHQHHIQSKSLSKNQSLSVETVAVTQTKQLKLLHISSLSQCCKEKNLIKRNQAWSSSRASIHLSEVSTGEQVRRMAFYRPYRHNSTRPSPTRIVARNYQTAGRIYTIWVLVKCRLRDNLSILPWRLLILIRQLPLVSYLLLITVSHLQIAMSQASKISIRWPLLALVRSRLPKTLQQQGPRHTYLSWSMKSLMKKLKRQFSTSNVAKYTLLKLLKTMDHWVSRIAKRQQCRQKLHPIDP